MWNNDVVRKQEMDCQVCAWKDQWECDILLPPRGANRDGGNTTAFALLSSLKIVFSACGCFYISLMDGGASMMVGLHLFLLI